MEEYTQKKQYPVVQPQQNNSLAIPIAIVFGFALIAVAVFFNGLANAKAQLAAVQSIPTNDPSVEATIKGPVRPINGSDHIRGNPNAEIVILEYSDFDCPFCKNFHETMNQIMKEYGTTGKVAWVYRHFPLESRHPSAKHIAIASECVAKFGGNDAFWKFSDLVFGERGVNDPTDVTRLSEFAKTAGVSGTAFDSCLENEDTKSIVEADMVDGINAGASGTPYSLVLVAGQQGVINGAQSYTYVKNVLDTLINQTKAKDTSNQQVQ